MNENQMMSIFLQLIVIAAPLKKHKYKARAEADISKPRRK